MEEEKNEIAHEEAKEFKGTTAGVLIGLVVGLSIVSSMAVFTSFSIVRFWPIFFLVILPIGWRLGRLLPKVSFLSILFLVGLCVVATVGPFLVLRLHLIMIVDQLSDFPSAELQESRVYLFEMVDYPGFVAQFTTNADARDVVEYYHDSLSKSGWVIIGEVVDDERSQAVVEYELSGRYILVLRKWNEHLWFGLSVRHSANSPRRTDLMRELDFLKRYYNPPRYPEP